MPEENENKLEIELMKKDMSILTTLINKFDVTIDKMQEIASNLSRMVSIQETRLETQEAVTKELQSTIELRRMEHNNDMKEMQSRINNVNRELTEKIEKTENTILAEIKTLREDIRAEKGVLNNKIMDIEAWKWLAAGGGAVALWFLSHIDLSKFFT